MIINNINNTSTEVAYITTSNTFAEIKALYDAGKTIILRQVYYFNLLYASSGSFIFGQTVTINNPADATVMYYTLQNNDTWTSGSTVVARNDSPIFTGTPAAPTAAVGTNTTQLATTAFVQGETNRKIVNRNLLDNPMFKIDQRQGYVVPPNVEMFGIDGTSGTWTTDDYYEVAGFYKYNDIEYAHISANGGNYACSSNNVIRGYCSSGYTVDRWALWNASPNVLNCIVEDDGITLIATANTGGQASFYEKIPNLELGKTYTLSVEVDNVIYSNSGQINSTSDSLYALGGAISFALQYSPSNSLWIIQNNNINANTRAKVGCIKLELGSVSTLAYDLEHGAYDESLDLMECQKYLRVDEAQSKVIGNLQTYSSNGDFAGYIPSSIDMKGIPTLTYENCYFAVEGAAHYPITSLFSSTYGCGGKATTSVPASTTGFLLIGDTGVTGRLIRSCEL